MKTILAIAVNFRDPEGAAAFTHSFSALLGAGEQWQGVAMVADNSADHTAQNSVTDRGVLPHAIWHNTGGNLGFFGGAKHALTTYLGAASQPEWVLVSNADIRFSDPQLALKLLDTAGAMVVAPQIRRDHPEGLRTRYLFDNPLKRERPSSGWLARRLWLLNHYPVYVAYNAVRSAQRRFATAHTAAPGPIYAPFGALMCFHRSYFEAGCTLDHPAFLFTEELFVAEQVRLAGGRVMFVPSMGATHWGSTSMSRVPSRQQARWGADSVAAVYSRYFARDRD
jgi:GT2 family glycosyltransferase